MTNVIESLHVLKPLLLAPIVLKEPAHISLLKSTGLQVSPSYGRTMCSVYLEAWTPGKEDSPHVWVDTFPVAFGVKADVVQAMVALVALICKVAYIRCTACTDMDEL